MTVASPSMRRAWNKPAVPTMNPRRRNRMIPRIVRMLGVKTPPNVPSPALVRASRRPVRADSWFTDGMFARGATQRQLAASR